MVLDILKRMVAVIVLVFILGCDSNSSSEMSNKSMRENDEIDNWIENVITTLPPKLIFERKWGYEDGDLRVRKSFWEPSFEYFFIRDKEVFIADYLGTEVYYYIDGVYKRKFDYPLSSIDNLFGLIVIGKIIYFFDESGQAFALSMTNEELLYSKAFSFQPNQSWTNVYKYEKIMVISDSHTGREEIKMCLDTKLTEIKCPDLMMLKSKKALYGDDYRYLSPTLVSFSESYLIKEMSKYNPSLNTYETKVNYINTKSNTIVGFAFNKAKVEDDMPGTVQYVKEGIYYTVHTDESAQIWYQPMIRNNNH